jgi:4-methyl-5(b-hydroxyethyl)-thiazole monophosphate biosynthesis
MEAVTVIDVLRRAGFSVTVASVHESTVVHCSRNVQLQADTTIDKLAAAQSFTAIVLPGGAKGAENLRDSTALLALLRAHVAARPRRWYGAICAAPAVVLAHHRLLPPINSNNFKRASAAGTAAATAGDAGAMVENGWAVCHPSFASSLLADGVAPLNQSEIESGPRVAVCASERCVTSIGPGSALEFALSLVHLLSGSADLAKTVAKPMYPSFDVNKLLAATAPAVAAL